MAYQSLEDSVASAGPPIDGGGPALAVTEKGKGHRPRQLVPPYAFVFPCETIVELAHHRGLREPNKAEFDPLLDRVMATSKDEVVVDRAQRYKKGETWNRPKAADSP